MNALFKKFDIKPNNKQLYEIAFTPSSHASFHNCENNYERLEFLGDAVLNVIVSEFLFKKYPNFEEGKLTKLRANYVCQHALIYYSKELGLDKFIKLNSDAELSQNEFFSVTADVFESFLGAIYLDQGMDFAQNYISKSIFNYINNEKIFFHDYKSQIKEYGDHNEIKISYKILREKGPSHNKTFTAAILMDGKNCGVGTGKSKKEAEQAAAADAMKRFGLGGF